MVVKFITMLEFKASHRPGIEMDMGCAQVDWGKQGFINELYKFGYAWICS
jgi:hypothetical protein